MQIFINELIGAVIQLLLFSLVPFLVWLAAGRTRSGENFFKWIGLKAVSHRGRWWETILLTVGAVLLYGGLTGVLVRIAGDGITSAGSSFAGMGGAGIPCAIVYGMIRTGLSEEIVFRGFFLKTIMRRFGFAAGNFCQALLFGLLHGIPFGLATGNVGIMVLFTFLPGAFGWYQGWLNERRCGGSIIPSFLLHGIMNTIVCGIGLFTL